MRPPPIAADLHPCADGCAVRTALVPGLGAVCLAGPSGTDRRTDRQTDGRTFAASLNAPYGAGIKSKGKLISLLFYECEVNVLSL